MEWKEKVKQRRELQGQGSLPYKEYGTNIKELKGEMRGCCSHLWPWTCGYLRKLNGNPCVNHVGDYCGVSALSSHPTSQIS